MQIYSFNGSAHEQKEQKKEESRFSRICNKVLDNEPLTLGLLSIFILVMYLIFLPRMVREYKETNQLIENQNILIEYAYQDFYSDEYRVIEQPEYMVELFPYGETDNQEYQVEDGRIIKTTWYKIKKDKKMVAHEEYYLLDPKQ